MLRPRDESEDVPVKWGVGWGERTTYYMDAGVQLQVLEDGCKEENKPQGREEGGVVSLTAGISEPESRSWKAEQGPHTPTKKALNTEV